MMELDRRTDPFKEILLESEAYEYLIYWDEDGVEGLPGLHLAQADSFTWTDYVGYKAGEMLLPRSNRTWFIGMTDTTYAPLSDLAWQDPQSFITLMLL